jgi:hypothetical protein
VIRSTFMAFHSVARTSVNRSSRRAGFTLIELVTNLVVMSVLIAGMAGSIHLAQLAVPKADSPSTLAIESVDLLEMIASDLRYAVSVPSITSNSVTLIVADRDGLSPASETISYSWSGVAGAPLIRDYNGSTSTILPSVQAFSLSRQTAAVTSAATYSEGPLVQLASYTASTNLTPDYGVTTTAWVGEYFLPNSASATSYKVKQLRFFARQNGTATGTTLVELRSASGGLPTTTIYDVQTMNESSLPTSFAQQTFNFTNCPSLPIGTGMCFVLRFGTNSPTCFIQRQGTGASPGTSRLLTTSNGGSSWASSATSSLLFEVWGSYNSANPSTTNYYLRNVRVTLQPSVDVDSRLETSVRILNEPQVAGP